MVNKTALNILVQVFVYKGVFFFFSLGVELPSHRVGVCSSLLRTCQPLVAVLFSRLTATYEFWLLHIVTVVGGINHSIVTVYNSDRYIVISHLIDISPMTNKKLSAFSFAYWRFFC